MGLEFFSTRNRENRVTASQAILQGLADDGGLFVPERIPRLDKSFQQLCRMNYRQVAYEVMKLFFTDFTEEELWHCINSAYTEEKFDHDDMAALIDGGNAFFLELYHGQTIAFKDMALSILPYLLTTSAKKNGISDEIVILTATSGDTGKAALAGFADTPGTRIVVYYPKGGVSPIQERQMVTQKGSNVMVVGVKGNFDDTQTAVKEMFNDAKLREELRGKGFRFSSANSINIGRLIPQVVYYVYAYTRILPDEVNFVVPTGNFGNILAAHYAAEMGVPVKKLICASNENNVLYDFFRTGVYDRNREFILTESPSMDILISSNLERLVYEVAGNDTAALMEQLKSTGRYEIGDENLKKLEKFAVGYADGDEMRRAIKKYFDAENYVIDTHTGVAAAVYNTYRAETGDDTTSIIVSTASPYKFARSVMKAIAPEFEESDDFELIEKMAEISGIKVPRAVSELRNAPVIHSICCEKGEMRDVLEKFLSKF